MKKMFFLILILLAGNLSLVAKNYYSEKEIRVSGFEGKKSLKELTLIAVSYPESPDDWYLEEAYKGETKDSFLKRINTPLNNVEKKKSHQVYKPLIPSSENLDKEEISFIQNFEEGYHPVYRRPPGIEKNRYLSLEELEDSLMMAEMELHAEKKAKDESVVSAASQEQKIFKESYLILVVFFVGLILLFILFGRIPLVWGTKNKK